MAKQKYKPKAFESTGISSDTSANIYMSMLLSCAWNNLTKNQQILYLYCKAQYYAEKRKPKTMVIELKEDKRNLCFTMNKAKWCSTYGLYKNGGQGRFKKDMQALINNGFIKEIENGKTSRTKNIYQFSSEWQNKK